MRTIAISNYKGGVGKTTTAVNLATIFAARGLRTLLVDLDPQASATDFFGLYDRAASERRTSVELLYGGAPVEEVAYAAGENLDVVASTIDLVDQNEMLLREQRLKFALDDASGSYEVCLIDCSPVMRRLAFNAYLAAAEGGMVVIPVKLDSTVMRGTALTVEATRSIADALRMPTPRWRILRTCVPGRMTNAEATGAAVLDGFFPGEQFETVIHASSKVCEGSWQMVSGHRRKAAYALLAKDDPAYERMPCRVIEGIDDERAVTLLHAANYFTRALTVTERAAATEALRGDAVRLRSEDPSLSGMRVDDVKAAIIERQTGRKVSGKTIAREERLARRIAEDLSPEWAAEADRGNLSAEAVRALAGMPKERQAEMHAAMEPWRRTKRELSDYVRSEGKAQAGPDGRIAKAARLVADFLESPPESPSAADLSLLREMALMTAPYADAGTDARKGRRRASGPKSSK